MSEFRMTPVSFVAAESKGFLSWVASRDSDAHVVGDSQCKVCCSLLWAGRVALMATFNAMQFVS